MGQIRLRVSGVKGRAALAGERIGGRWESRRELAGGEGVEGAEAGGEFGVGQAALAVEPAEEIWRGGSSLFGVAIQTAGDEGAVGVAPRLHARDHLVEGPTP